jgi:hypothetical protein
MGASCAEGAFSPARARAYAYDEVVREEELTPERVHEIVREALAQRIVDDETDHAKLQLARLAPAMQIAGMAVADGEGDPGVFQSARSARPHPAGRRGQVYDDEARKRLFDKIKTPISGWGRQRTGRLRARISDAAAGKEEQKKMPSGVSASL